MFGVDPVAALRLLAEADSSLSRLRATLPVGSLTGENSPGTLDGAAAGLEIVGEPEGVVPSTPGGLERPSEEPERSARFGLAPSVLGRAPTGELVAEREAPPGAFRLLPLLLLLLWVA